MHTETENRQDPGRDSKLTKERQEAIAAMIEDGHSITSAARSNGVTKQTVMNWLDRGETQENGIYAQFFDRYTRARGEGEKTYLDLVMNMAEEEDDHRFIASLMKQRYPESWGDTETGVEADTLNIQVSEQVKSTFPE
jgi:transposase-like protein